MKCMNPKCTSEDFELVTTSSLTDPDIEPMFFVKCSECETCGPEEESFEEARSYFEEGPAVDLSDGKMVTLGTSWETSTDLIGDIERCHEQIRKDATVPKSLDEYASAIRAHIADELKVPKEVLEMEFSEKYSSSRHAHEILDEQRPLGVSPFRFWPAKWEENYQEYKKKEIKIMKGQRAMPSMEAALEGIKNLNGYREAEFKKQCIWDEMGKLTGGEPPISLAEERVIDWASRKRVLSTPTVTTAEQAKELYGEGSLPHTAMKAFENSDPNSVTIELDPGDKIAFGKIETPIDAEKYPHECKCGRAGYQSAFKFECSDSGCTVKTLKE